MHWAVKDEIWRVHDWVWNVCGLKAFNANVCSADGELMQRINSAERSKEFHAISVSPHPSCNRFQF
jgi:hypothetical protein